MKTTSIIKLMVLSILFFSVSFAQAGDVRSIYVDGILRFYDSETNETIDVMTNTKWFEDFNWQAAARYIVYNSTTAQSGDRSVPPTISCTMVNSGSMSVQANSGALKIGLGPSASDNIELSSELIFFPNKNCSAEARIRLSTTSIAFCFGFNEQKSEGAGKLGATVSGSALTLYMSDGAVIFSDSSATNNNFRTIAAKATVSSGTVVTSTAVDTDYHIFRVDCNENGLVTFWLDGDVIGLAEDAITTTTPLCVYVGIMRKDDAAQIVYADIDYIRAWQSR